MVRNGGEMVEHMCKERLEVTREAKKDVSAEESSERPWWPRPSTISHDTGTKAEQEVGGPSVDTEGPFL